MSYAPSPTSYQSGERLVCVCTESGVCGGGVGGGAGGGGGKEHSSGCLGIVGCRG